MKNLTVISGQESRLLHYDAACRALAEAHRIDEVTHIHDMAAAAQEYARQAQNYDLEKQAFAIRKRAERKAGQLLKEMPKNRGGGSNQHQSKPTTGAPSLDKLGLTRDKASKWQKEYSANTDEEFEAKLAKSLEGPRPNVVALKRLKPKTRTQRPPDLTGISMQWSIISNSIEIPPQNLID